MISQIPMGGAALLANVGEGRGDADGKGLARG